MPKSLAAAVLHESPNTLPATIDLGDPPSSGGVASDVAVFPSITMLTGYLQCTRSIVLVVLFVPAIPKGCAENELIVVAGISKYSKTSNCPVGWPCRDAIPHTLTPQ